MKKGILTCIFLLSIPFALFGKDVMPLDSIELSNKIITFSMDEALGNPETTYRLCQGGHDIHSLPSDFKTLVNLYEFNVSQNYLKTLPYGFCSLKYLYDLNLSTNELETLPACFSNLTNLTFLNISGNPNLDWNEVFDILGNMKSLESLDISFCEASSIPTNINNLKFLKELYLTGNDFNENQKSSIMEILTDTLIYF